MTRPYNSDRRLNAAIQTRARIIETARKLLVSRGGIGKFTLDAVAEKAKVGRMTVYEHFGSRMGLIEAIADTLQLRLRRPDIAAMAEGPDLAGSIEGAVALLCACYAADRPLLKRLIALAVLDPKIDKVLAPRKEGRREIFCTALDRAKGISPADGQAIANLLYALTSFEIYDQLAHFEPREDAVAAQMLLLCRRCLP